MPNEMTLSIDDDRPASLILYDVHIRVVEFAMTIGAHHNYVVRSEDARISGVQFFNMMHFCVRTTIWLRESGRGTY